MFHTNVSKKDCVPPFLPFPPLNEQPTLPPCPPPLFSMPSKKQTNTPNTRKRWHPSWHSNIATKGLRYPGTLDVTLPTIEPGLPISLFFSSCCTTSRGPMVFARYVNSMSSAVTVSTSLLRPYTPALLITTCMLAQRLWCPDQVRVSAEAVRLLSSTVFRRWLLGGPNRLAADCAAARSLTCGTTVCKYRYVERCAHYCLQPDMELRHVSL